MKEHKYYICIDELEVYNGDHDIYIRDLTMIRDLIITTKRINALLRANGIRNVKIILSVRTEVVNSIMRELPGLEYNKDLGGFAEKINWSAPIVDFIYHPLSIIWIKRIQESLNEKSYDMREIYMNMFPQIIGIERTIEYVVERTWNKPRDIIRVMSCLHEIIDENVYYYDAKKFVESMTEYSKQSWGELVEELSAIYTSSEIEKIFTCLTAFKKHFTRKELKERLKSGVVSTYNRLEVDKIIVDLYRIGIIGLRNFSTEEELWGYLGHSAVEDDEWRYIIHRGLWRELKLEKEAYDGIPYIDIVGISYECVVENRDNNYLKVSFDYEEKKLSGVIHAKNITGRYTDLDKYIGKRVNAFVIGYNTKRRVWELSKIFKKAL